MARQAPEKKSNENANKPGSNENANKSGNANLGKNASQWEKSKNSESGCGCGSKDTSNLKKGMQSSTPYGSPEHRTPGKMRDSEGTFARGNEAERRKLKSGEFEDIEEGQTEAMEDDFDEETGKPGRRSEGESKGSKNPNAY